MKALSTKAVKRITTILVVSAFVFMFAGPRVIKRPPQMTAKRFAVRLFVYSGALGLSAVGALVGAFVIMRREQAVYREKAMENMRALIEATRQDRLQKQEDGEDSDA
ncbi:hypothetical protein [Fimbriimonas ginsengisoli]|uniref:Uncharacterized protein n=1 Tax=Fimbriimonas ginsengisoli Gsoil 348 TaxID=661478 RepID=A0A068NQR4_FIMGI|nr:hypothetical protein [Fimbriimonas ginsengisoli]AIE85786.1 hypothetical protein OP10G_2418 [Fimbriimonas ginsengisoli Gsoil 348]